MSSWKKISLANVPQVSAEIGYLKHNVASLAGKRGEMADASDRLVARWGTMADSYATRHSIEAVQRMAPLRVGVEAAATGIDQSIDAIDRLISDLEAVETASDELTRDIFAFLTDAAPLGAVWLNDFSLYVRNAALRRRRDNIVSDQAEAVRRCADALARVHVDAHEDDPNFGIAEYKGTPLHEGRLLDVPLFGTSDDVNGDQVRQGMVGDCWLMATMMSLADADPEFVKRMVIDNEDGTYTVKLYKDGKRHDVVVDGDFLLNDKEQPAFAGGGKNATALWPLLVEKAIAQDLGGYDAIVSDQSNRAMKILLGEHPKQDINSQAGIMGRLRNWGDTDLSDEDMRRLVQDDHAVMVACTEGKDLEDFKLESGGTVTIHGDHCYQVAAVDLDRDHNYHVTVVNPWNDPKADGGGGDVITFSMDEFRRKYREINWASTR